MLLPAGPPHTFLVGADAPLRATGPGLPAETGPVDPVALGHAAARHGIDVLGPPPTH
ncbi:hypothetical protein [Actinoplanes aureus]|uniref:hypothetical protein n=1 Tax=Actinoplanes aureus TaxID=2792083 RepID=UPI001E551B13|nr:hypothetical protein [Actinoplanes aureus]